MKLSNTIKNLRIQKGLTQYDLANALGVHFQTVSKWERDLSLPDLAVLGDIAKCLDVSFDVLMGGEDNEYSQKGVFHSQKLGDTISHLRKNSHATQSEFAGIIGVSADTVSKWERGVISPDVDKLVEIAKEFGVNPSEIYYGNIQDRKNSNPSPKKRSKKGVILTLICAVVVIAVAVGVLLLSGEGMHTCEYLEMNTSEDYLMSPATCKDRAKYYYSCACGKMGSKVFSYGELEEHVWGSYEYNNDALCEKDGTETAYCTAGCGASDTRTKTGSALSHSYTNYLSDNNATYESDGTMTANCDNGCGSTDTKTDFGSMLVRGSLHFKSMSVLGEEAKKTVSHATEQFDFSQEIEVTGPSEFVLSRDEYGGNRLGEKVINLEIGNNSIYVLEIENGVVDSVYAVTIYRKDLFSVKFELEGGEGSYDTLFVEEGDLAEKPSIDPVKAGHQFIYWTKEDGFEFYFSTPITEHLVLYASYCEALDVTKTYTAKYTNSSPTAFGSALPTTLYGGDKMVFELDIVSSTLPENKNYNLMFHHTNSNLFNGGKNVCFFANPAYGSPYKGHISSSIASATNPSINCSEGWNPSKILVSGYTTKLVYTVPSETENGSFEIYTKAIGEDDEKYVLIASITNIPKDIVPALGEEQYFYIKLFTTFTVSAEFSFTNLKGWVENKDGKEIIKYFKVWNGELIEG